MIQSGKMRITVGVLALSSVLVGAVAPADAASATPAPSTVAVYWQPPGTPEPGAVARATFVEAMTRQGARVVDAPSRVSPAPSLRPRLEAAQAAYERFAFTQAIAELDELQGLCDARGGGDLSGRQLSELFLYRGLARLETAGADAAWDDLVRAARLDPARVLDPVRFPPRAVTAFAGAVAQSGAGPRARLIVEAPAGAAIRVDGESAASGGAAVALGPHFLAVDVEGYEPWAGIVSVAGVREVFAPTLRPYQPPDGDRLLALAGEPPPRRLILGALEASPTGWRFVVSALALPEGKLVSRSASLHDVPTRFAVASLVAGVTSDDGRPASRWGWPTWVVAGGALVLTSVVTTWLATRDTSSPNVVGHLDSLR